MFSACFALSMSTEVRWHREASVPPRALTTACCFRFCRSSFSRLPDAPQGEHAWPTRPPARLRAKRADPLLPNRKILERIREFVGILGFDERVLEWNQECLRLRSLAPGAKTSLIRSFPSAVGVRCENDSNAHPCNPMRERGGRLRDGGEGRYRATSNCNGAIGACALSHTQHTHTPRDAHAHKRVADAWNTLWKRSECEQIYL